MNAIIKDLIQDPTVNRVEENGNLYGIRVIRRGENLFFQENNKGLICQINATHSVIFANTIKKWEGRKIMTLTERERVTELVLKYYKKVYSKEAKLLYEN